jgi:hypothetical protein
VDTQPNRRNHVRVGLSSPAARHHRHGHHGNKSFINHLATHKEIMGMQKELKNLERLFLFFSLKRGIWLHF